MKLLISLPISGSPAGVVREENDVGCTVVDTVDRTCQGNFPAAAAVIGADAPKAPVEDKKQQDKIP
jgi:hypothetical protein